MVSSLLQLPFPTPLLLQATNGTFCELLDIRNTASRRAPLLASVLPWCALLLLSLLALHVLLRAFQCTHCICLHAVHLSQPAFCNELPYNLHFVHTHDLQLLA